MHLHTMWMDKTLQWKSRFLHQKVLNEMRYVTLITKSRQPLSLWMLVALEASPAKGMSACSLGPQALRCSVSSFSHQWVRLILVEWLIVAIDVAG